jgi:uroporphyrinogen-III synthase
MTQVLAHPLVAVTRDEQPDDLFSQQLERHGLQPLRLPTIRIVAPHDTKPLEAALREVARFDWVVFTSAHAVEAICQRTAWLCALRVSASHPRVAAVGRATGERLAAYGVEVSLIPGKADGAQALASSLITAAPMGTTHVLWPRSAIASPELAEALRSHGAVVVDPPAYDTIPVVPPALPGFLHALSDGRVAAAAFLSPSSARGLAAALGGTLSPLTGRTLVASLGPTTSAALAELGTNADIEAVERRGSALAAAIAERLSARHGDAA